MTVPIPNSCYTLVATFSAEAANLQLKDLQSALEQNQDRPKIEAMKRIIARIIGGDPCPSMLMYVIRFVMPSKNKTLKKLLLIYWEICPKFDADGKLKQEMILVWYLFLLSSLFIQEFDNDIQK